MPRRLIAELAEDISCGDRFGEYDAGFFLDSLLDERRVTPDDVAILLTRNEMTDAHVDTSGRVRAMVMQSAADFSANNDLGIDFIDGRLALERAEAADMPV